MQRMPPHSGDGYYCFLPPTCRNNTVFLLHDGETLFMVSFVFFFCFLFLPYFYFLTRSAQRKSWCIFSLIGPPNIVKEKRRLGNSCQNMSPHLGDVKYRNCQDWNGTCCPLFARLLEGYNRQPRWLPEAFHFARIVVFLAAPDSG